MKKLNIKAMSEAIEKIVSSLGYDVLKAVNVNKFQSAVNDFMPGTMFEVEKQTLSQCIRIGIGDKFIQAIGKAGEEQKRTVANIHKTLTEDYAFREDRADCIIGAFAQALKISSQVYNIDEARTEAVQPIIIKETINANSTTNSSSANYTLNVSKNKHTNSHSNISNASHSKTFNQPITNENSLGFEADNSLGVDNSLGLYVLWLLLILGGMICRRFLFDYKWSTISIIFGVALICTTMMVSVDLWSIKIETFFGLILKIIFVITVWFAAYHFGLGKFLTYMWG